METPAINNTLYEVDIDFTTPLIQTDENGEGRNLVIFRKSLNINKSQLITIVLLSSYFFLSSAYYSLFAPFFPSEALNKKISQTQVGIIFGIFEFFC